MTAPLDQRSDQIRRAAAELFFNHGFEATTTRGIAQVLGIKSASIYYHYEDKQEILRSTASCCRTQVSPSISP